MISTPDESLHRRALAGKWRDPKQPPQLTTFNASGPLTAALLGTGDCRIPLA
jgi:hypothetical protein